MIENTGGAAPKHTEKKIGGTTFIVNTSYNGNKNHDIFKTVYRLVERGVFASTD